MNSFGLPPGKRVRLYDAYIEKRHQLHAGQLDAAEAMSVSDFPVYMAMFIRHTFLNRFQEIQGAWSQYTRDFSLEDFEEYTSSRWGRFTDIPEKALNGPYDQLTIAETEGETMKLREWGAGFSLTRQLIISDRLNKIKELPGLLAEALARTMSKVAAQQLSTNPVMYDGYNLVSADHENLLAATALTANYAGRDLIQAAELCLSMQTDEEGYRIQTPKSFTLIHPVEYRWIVNALMNNDMVVNVSSNLEVNTVKGTFTAIEEPMLTDKNDWWMTSDLKGPLGPIAHITLNGNTTPFLGLKDPGVRGVLGGDDPYSFEFDEIEYKLRHDFNFKPYEWRGIVGAFPA